MKNEPVEVLLGRVSSSKVVDERSDLDPLGFLPSAVLDERSEGSGSRSETGHDDGLGVQRRKLRMHGQMRVSSLYSQNKAQE